MSSPIYQGLHRKLFEAFLNLVDDSETLLAALLSSTDWKDAHSLLSVGGGQGIIEASILRNAPHASLWYLDPSGEQCDAFRQYMKTAGLSQRVRDIAQTTYQDYRTDQRFDRVLSIFSWFYIGTEGRWLTKLLNLLTVGGTAILVLPNITSIETIFYRAFSPDRRMTLVGEEVVSALGHLDCTVVQKTYVKWLKTDELFVAEQLSDGSLALAAFAAERPVTSFKLDEIEKIAELIKTNHKARGVPLSWDLILVTRNS